MLSQSQYPVVDEHVTQDKKDRETYGLSGHHAFKSKTVRRINGAVHDTTGSVAHSDLQIRGEGGVSKK